MPLTKDTLFQISMMAGITPMIYNWQASNTAGDTKKKTTSAVVFVGMCLGNVIGPLWVFSFISPSSLGHCRQCLYFTKKLNGH